MATYTDNYNLVKPDTIENANIGVINGNMDSIDGAIKSVDVKADGKANADMSNVGFQTIRTAAGLVFQQGVSGTITATKQTVTTMTVNFETAYIARPMVSVNLSRTDAIGTSGNLGYVSQWIKYLTDSSGKYSGITIHIASAYTSDISDLRVYWGAIGRV